MQNVGNRRITDAGLVYVGELSNLEHLSLDHTSITGAGLVHLKALTNLTFLSLRRLGQVTELYGTEVTDAQLENFKGLSKLQRLHLEGTGVTDDGVKKLRRALPNCKISR